MSLEKLINIERVEFEVTKERIQETFFVNNLTLLELIKEVLEEVEIDIIPILKIKILLYALSSVPFNDEQEVILDRLNRCMEHQFYGESNEWNCKTIATEIKKLRDAISYDISIEGSLALSNDYDVKWNLMLALIL